MFSKSIEQPFSPQKVSDLMTFLNRVDLRRADLSAKAQAVIDMRLELDEIKFKQQKQSELIKSTLLSKGPSKSMLPDIFQNGYVENGMLNDISAINITLQNNEKSLTKFKFKGEQTVEQALIDMFGEQNIKADNKDLARSLIKFEEDASIIEGQNENTQLMTSFQNRTIDKTGLEQPSLKNSKLIKNRKKLKKSLKKYNSQRDITASVDNLLLMVGPHQSPKLYNRKHHADLEKSPNPQIKELGKIVSQCSRVLKVKKRHKKGESMVNVQLFKQGQLDE